jgi:hypothetical protein
MHIRQRSFQSSMYHLDIDHWMSYMLHLVEGKEYIGIRQRSFHHNMFHLGIDH